MFPLNLTLLHCGAIAECTAQIDQVFKYHTLQLMTEGAVELSYGDDNRVLEGAWFWFAKSGPRIRFHPAPGTSCWSHRYLVFHGPLAMRWMAEGLLPNLAQPMPEDKDYAVVFDEMLTLAKRTDFWGQARAINLLEQIIFALAEARTHQPCSDAWLLSAREWLENASDFSPDYMRMASDLGMSMSALRDRFRNSAGKPLHSYILEYRMAKARQMLGDTDMPLKEVAAQLGYCDVYYFHRQFRQMVGVTPSAYRKSRQR